MKTDWIVNTLDDMRSFAVMNDLAELAHQLDIAAEVARREGGRADDVKPNAVERELGQDRRTRSGSAASR